MEISNLYSTSTILVEYERTTKKVPTMKSLDADKKANKASESKAVENCDQIATVEEKIDFSNVKIEPLFEEEVDFDTFSKSDFRAVKVKECVAVPKSKKLYSLRLMTEQVLIEQSFPVFMHITSRKNLLVRHLSPSQIFLQEQ